MNSFEGMWSQGGCTMKRKSIKIQQVTAVMVASVLSFTSPLLIAANTENQNKMSTSEQQLPSKASYVFLQNAKEARIEQVADKPNAYVLTLINVQPNVSYISERPQNKTGSMPLERFMQEWFSQSKDSFKNYAPNAFIHGLQDKKEKIVNTGRIKSEADAARNKAKAKNQPVPEPVIVNFAAQLSEPKFDAKNNILTYQINNLEGKSNNIAPAMLRHVTLFIDDGPCLSCW